MPDQFEIPIIYKDKELSLPAELLPMGYTYKIKVLVNDIDVLFEPDEEKEYRATVSNEDRERAAKLDIDLLKVISDTLKVMLA